MEQCSPAVGWNHIHMQLCIAASLQTEMLRSFGACFVSFVYYS